LVPSEGTAEWSELEAGCENESERAVLTAIRNAGLPAPSAAQRVVYDGDVPVAKPDFYYDGLKCAVFVDGSIHELDFVKAGDETVRQRLKRLGYGVVEITTSTVDAGIDDLSKRIKL
jgi:very-short-patch-repair endonuclease